MLMHSLANYLTGSVRVKISGSFPERFINLCLARGIILWGITRHDDGLSGYMRLPDFFRVRPLARASRTRVSVMGFAGFPFAVKRLRRRKMMVAGFVLALIIVNVLTSYVWFVDVSGHRTVSGERVREIAAARGLKPGTSKSLLDLKAVERDILLAVPEVAWVGITLTGTRAGIEVVEKTLPRPEDKSPAHIVAAKDGVITEIIVIAGQPAVKKGDTVKKGDLLIRGFVPVAPAPAVPGQPPVITVPDKLIRAGGIVKARVWCESYGEASLTQQVLRRTGRQVVAVTVIAGGREFVLKAAPAQPYPAFETEVIHKKLPGGRNREFTVESKINIFHELGSETFEISAEAARDLARGRALAAAQDAIPEGAQILSRDIATIEASEPRLVRVKATVETIEEIGQTMNITQQ